MKNRIYIIITIALSITTLGFAFLWIRTYFCADINHDSLEKLYFIGGVISGIFAFAAFGAALWSGLMQKKTNDLQRFETTLFNMLSLQQQIVNDLLFTINKTDRSKHYSPTDGFSWEEVSAKEAIKGRQVFEFLFAKALWKYENKTIHGIKDFIATAGLSRYCDANAPTLFDHYFRHLYTIIKFIDQSDFLEDKYKYTSMVRATLSRYELVWIYYNCLSDVGKTKFKPLIEEYSILKNMRDDLLSLSKEAQDFLRDRNITTIQEVKDEGFTGKDYEFFLTKEKGNQDKYYIGAFYNKDNLHKGKKLVDDWDAFIKSKQKGHAE